MMQQDLQNDVSRDKPERLIAQLVVLYCSSLQYTQAEDHIAHRRCWNVWRRSAGSQRPVGLIGTATAAT